MSNALSSRALLDYVGDESFWSHYDSSVVHFAATLVAGFFLVCFRLLLCGLAVPACDIRQPVHRLAG
jgi:hypothetical protein